MKLDNPMRLKQSFIQSISIQWVLGVKRSEPEDHSPSSSAEIKKNAWCHSFTPQYVFIA
jgi:hypothetical protein